MGKVQVSQYANKLSRINTSMVGVWPLSESASTTSYDLSGNDYHGTNSGIDRTNTYRSFLAPDGGRTYRFDGTSSYVDLVSAAPASATGAGAGTLAIWLACDEAVLSSSTKSQIYTFAVDANNHISLSFDTTPQRFVIEHVANSTNKSIVSPLLYNDYWGRQFPLWSHHVLRFSITDNDLSYFVDGVKQTSVSSLDSGWAGSFSASKMVLGSSDSGTPADLFTGFLSNFAWWSVALSDDECIDCFKVP